MIAESRVRWRGPLSPLVHLANNWISMLGVLIVTTAGVFWLFLLPTTVKAEAANPYIGILSYMGLPGLFFAGLFLIPLGIWLRNRAEHRAGIYPSHFPPLDFRNRELRRLVTFVALASFVNIVIASQTTYAAINYMDSVSFCGETCHTVMQPEFTAFKNSPHSRLECVHCHIGPGASWFVRSKLSGVRQVFAVMLHTYSTPIPSPVHNLRPARETCETCHWPQKYSEDRLRVFPKYADDETNTLTKTVMMLKVGGGNKGVGIHGTHLGSGIKIRYVPADEARQKINCVEYTNQTEKRRTLYLAEGARPQPGAAAVREMDCMDCHNRPSHTYELPERAVDNAMYSGQISAALPFARKKSVELLRIKYATRQEAARKIPAEWQKFYEQSYPAVYAERKAEVAGSGNGVLAIYNRNIFPEMKVDWGVYPVNVGHTDFPGCFRCHDDSHASADGRKITQDCTSCHNLLAMEEPSPKILTDLGLVK